ncbi:hypothetical protein Plec18167_004108 [Paecilomyces lecythidis]|uniref:Cupin type-2 domain-containing protein n=1 Tax=Paecilomyces lecythidis TaxID=3004212 RepID=A0ABR3XUH5_9EURO
MAANTNGDKGGLKPLAVAPGTSGKAYKLESYGGENIYIPGSRSATRMVVTGKESNNAFAVIGSAGSYGDPIGFHFHREAHDVFLCLQGRVNVWAGKTCRTMEPGDFASVPPNTIHQYQILGDHSEFVGLIVPGGWEEFFRAIGDVYDGPMWPVKEEGNPLEILLPRIKAAAEKHDMVPCPDYEFFGPQPWNGSETSLPGAWEPYFLRAGSAPRSLVGGVIVSPLITTAESNGVFTIGSIEGSSRHTPNPVLQGLTFASSHHCFLVTEGFFELQIEGNGNTTLGPYETVYIPQGTKFSVNFGSQYSKAYVFANGGGLVELLRRIGSPYSYTMVLPVAESVDVQKAKAQESQLSFSFGNRKDSVL